MRVRIPILAIVGAVASASVAAAQGPVATSAPAPEGSGSYQNQSNGAMAGEAGSRRYRYLARVESLKEKVARTKAKDGGQLTPEHEASLKHELDRLNRLYGVKPG